MTDDANVQQLVEEISRLRGQVAQLQDRVAQLDHLAHQDSLIDLPNHAGRLAQLQIDWPTAVKPQFGVSSTATVLVQQKDGALIVPQKAIRTAGPRRYVEYLDGSQRRVANVEVGIVSGVEAEVLSGLIDGQSVLVPQ